MNAEIVSRRIESASRTTGCYNSPESKKASNGIRAMLKSAFPDCTVTHSVGHFYCSGFVRRTDKVVYYSISDYRYFPDSGFVRTAKDEKDYTGGANVNVNCFTLVNAIQVLLQGWGCV